MLAEMIKAPTYNRGLYVVTSPRWDDLKREMRKFDPKTDLGKAIKLAFKHLPVDLAWELMDVVNRSVILSSTLAVVVTRPPHSLYNSRDVAMIEDYGITSRKKVTTAGVTALCLAWANATFDMKYMALGTGNTAESNAQTNLTTEIAASHYTSSVRVTCTHAESTNTVPLVGAHTHATAGDTIEEHGIFSSSTQGATGLWDRSLTGTQTLAVGDGLTATYTLTASAEA